MWKMEHMLSWMKVNDLKLQRTASSILTAAMPIEKLSSNAGLIFRNGIECKTKHISHNTPAVFTK